MNKIMQITAFKAILARRINIRGCEDYKNTLARIESDCTLRFGFKALIKSISYTKQSSLFLHFLSTLKRLPLSPSQETDDTIRVVLPFKDQISADIVKKQLIRI